MTKDELKELGLTEEQIAAVIEDYGKNYVAKSQFNQKNEELKQVKGEVDTLKGDIDALKKSNKDNEELTAQIDKLKADYKAREEEYNANIKQMKIDSTVDRALSGAKAKNNKAVRALLNLDGLEVEGDTIKGLEEQINAVKENNAYLFGASVPTSPTPGVPSGSNGGITPQEFKSYSYAQRVELKQNHPEQYDALTKGE